MHLKEFINTDFKEFSNYDNVRSIPSVIDGLKDSQRKAVYGMFCHGNSEIRVAQLSGQASLYSHYEHGEASMAGTIVGLAQDFPGSNNLNLFQPIGQFGSILSSESSAHRYIYTKPSNNLRYVIRKDDDCILEHKTEDGDKVEPYHYYPILPLWLINGCVGIGTGHSVKILPRSLDNVKRVIQSEMKGESWSNELLIPHFEGWKGTVEQVGGEDSNTYELTGNIEVTNTTTIRVTELPVTYSVDKFKEILVKLMDDGKIKDFDNNSTEEGFNFTIKVPRETGKKSRNELIDLFKLKTKVTENITLWNSRGDLERYPSIRDALEDFIDYRLEKYEERRQKQIDILHDEIDFMQNKRRFIQLWVGLDNPSKMDQSEIADYMMKNEVREDYLNQLFLLPIRSLTGDRMKELESDIDSREKEVDKLSKSKNRTLFRNEIKAGK